MTVPSPAERVSFLSTRPMLRGLHLAPDLARYRFLSWRSFDALYEAGYRCAKERLEAGALPRTLWEGRLADTIP